MNVLDKHIVYFIGIGGIGMSALARWFKAQGHEVLGYDKTSTTLTKALEDEGMVIHYKDNISFIPKESNPSNTLVIYTPAVPKSHSELIFFEQKEFDILKMSAVLGAISKNYYTVAVAGTHGKTTTSSMIAHLLNFAGIDTTAFLGGIATNFNSNLLIGKTPEAIAVVEADEYDRSFLQLSPNIEVITSTDPDHLDIYGDASEMKSSFAEFIQRLQKDGQLLASDKVDNSLLDSETMIYGLGSGTIKAENIRISDCYTFDFNDGDTEIKDIELFVPGFHNTENAVAAIKIALMLGVKPDIIRGGMAAYKGVKRRFEYIIKKDFVFIDDYAHHPEELRAFISSVRAMYPEQTIKVIFQPHLFSRTNDFHEEFAKSLDLADEIVLLDIYPARELPIEGVTSHMISEKMLKKAKHMSFDEVIEELKEEKPQVLATLGAGDIDQLVPEIKQILTETYGS
jgi:UDP-N-acetylmuramate--alanine ligase